MPMVKKITQAQYDAPMIGTGKAVKHAYKVNRKLCAVVNSDRFWTHTR